MKKILSIAGVLLLCLSLLPLCAQAAGEYTEAPAAETDGAGEYADESEGPVVSIGFDDDDTETPEVDEGSQSDGPEEETPAEQHVHDYQGVVTKAPTCTEPGEKTYTCRGCGDFYTEIVPAGHAWGDWTVTQAATRTEAGERVRTCTACGTTETEVIPVLTGEWVETPDGWQFRYGDGSFDASMFVEIGEKTYYINDDGFLFLETDWLEIDGSYYYFKSGAMATGLQKIGSNYYLFNEDGTIFAGWVKYNGAMYFYDTSYSWNYGKLVTGWREIEAGTYNEYIDGISVGETDVGGGWYYFSPSTGKMLTGLQKIGGYYYFFNNDGTVYTGWVKYNGAIYYYDVNNWARLATGWAKIPASTYNYFDGTTTEVEAGGGWYYFNSGGKMQTGWHFLYGDYYYFYTGKEENPGPVGSAAYDVVIDGYQLQTDGTMVGGKQVYMILNSYWYSSGTKYMIVVDTYTCKVGVFYGSAYNWSLQYFWDCSPGKASTPTVTGVFTVGDKGYYFDSYGSRCYWYTQFCGNYLFHSVLYNTDGTLQDGRLGMNLSHGCVRLAYNNAYWIYKNIPRGTTVVVY